MTPIQAPERVSVPRPPTVQTSYLSPRPASSADPSKPAEIADAFGPDRWRHRRGPLAALVRATIRKRDRGGRPLLAEPLPAPDGLSRPPCPESASTRPRGRGSRP